MTSTRCCRHADVAMYGAKDEKSGFVFYDGSRNETDPARLTLVSELRRAIEERELVLYYQPKAALTDGAVRLGRGAAALEPPDSRPGRTRTSSSRSPSRPG